jgi:hypothetical protein
MDLEAAKTATVDSMEWQWKAKSDRFHAGRNDKGRNPKETIIVNQPEIIHHNNPNKKERLSRHRLKP